MAITAATVGICIAVGCSLFKIVSWVIIYRNAQWERRRMKARESLQLTKRDTHHYFASSALFMGDNDDEDSGVETESIANEEHEHETTAGEQPTSFLFTATYNTGSNPETDPGPEPVPSDFEDYNGIVQPPLPPPAQKPPAALLPAAFSAAPPATDPEQVFHERQKMEMRMKLQEGLNF